MTTETNKFSFIWSIDNIALNPMCSNKMFCSPTFSVGGFGFTKWRLVMYPRGTVDKEYISLYLHRQYGGPALSDIPINFKLSLDSIVIGLRSVRTCCNISFKEDEYWGYPKFVKIDSLTAVIATSLTRAFTVRCDMSPSDECKVNLARSVRMDLKVFSENLKSLYESQQLYDVILRSKNEDFKVHKAILSARSPKFAQFLGLDNDDTASSVSMKDVSSISAPVLKTLLFFLYSGELDIPRSAIPRELLTIASRYELPELVQKMRIFPEICIARTCLNVEHKSITWNVKNVSSLTSANQSFVHIIPTTNVYIHSLIAYCGLFINSKSGIKLINASFRLTGLMKEKPVFLKFRIGTDIESIFWELHSEGHLFECDEEWKVSFSFEKSPFAQMSINRLGFEFDICDGVGSSLIQDSWITQTDYSTPYNDYSQLSEDLEKLLSNRTFSDVSIICGYRTFEAHKAILAARSPVFEKMFEHNLIENQNGVVNIPDVRPAIMALVLSYMYRGIIEDLMYEEALELYEAADKYRILVLKEKCAAILVFQMTHENAEEIANLADMHFDFNLRERAICFITSRKVITCKLENGGEWRESLI